MLAKDALADAAIAPRLLTVMPVWMVDGVRNVKVSATETVSCPNVTGKPEYVPTTVMQATNKRKLPV